jgi:hypothetical protein
MLLFQKSASDREKCAAGVDSYIFAGGSGQPDLEATV